MTEYTNIEAYCPCNEATFEDFKLQFQKLVEALAMPPSVQEWLTSLTWEVATDEHFEGFVFMKDTDEVEFGRGQQSVQLRPSLLGYTQAKWYSESWMSVDFLIDFSTVTTWGEKYYQYNSGVESILWELMQKIFSVFPAKGIYLTNEGSDGSTMDYLTGKDRTAGEQWWFDAAIVPSTLISEFTPVPEKIIGVSHNQTHFFANKSVWRTLPWEAK